MIVLLQYFSVFVIFPVVTISRISEEVTKIQFYGFMISIQLSPRALLKRRGKLFNLHEQNI